MELSTLMVELECLSMSKETPKLGSSQTTFGIDYSLMQNPLKQSPAGQPFLRDFDDLEVSTVC